MLFLTKNDIEEKRHNRGVFALINPHSEHGDSDFRFYLRSRRAESCSFCWLISFFLHTALADSSSWELLLAACSCW